MNKRFILLAAVLATVGLITLGTLEYRGQDPVGEKACPGPGSVTGSRTPR